MAHSPEWDDPQLSRKPTPAIFKQLAKGQQKLTNGSGRCPMIHILYTQVSHPPVTVKVVGKGGKKPQEKNIFIVKVHNPCTVIR